MKNMYILNIPSCDHSSHLASFVFYVLEKMVNSGITIYTTLFFPISEFISGFDWNMVNISSCSKYVHKLCSPKYYNFKSVTYIF